MSIAPYEWVSAQIKRMPYKQLIARRNLFTESLENGKVYVLGMARTPASDLLIVAWLNAEISRRISEAKLWMSLNQGIIDSLEAMVILCPERKEELLEQAKKTRKMLIGLSNTIQVEVPEVPSRKY
jgi:hypothetical protein